MPVKLTFALRQQKMLGIEEVEKGLACNCYCPQCGARLMAKKGAKQAHHFAHYNKQECEGALETSLHRMAKQLIVQYRKMVVPPLRLHRQQKFVSIAKLISFEKGTSEQYTKGYIPDITLIRGSKQLHIEIALTHKVETRKINQMRRGEVPVIEIDALSIYEEQAHKKQLTLKNFSQELIHGILHKKWLYNPKKEKIEYALRKRSHQKPVRHQLYKGYHNFHVRDCPLNKRIRRGYFLNGASYANVLQDCAHCSRCLEIEYEKEWVGFREVPLFPRMVYCWGELQEPKVGIWWEPI